jgi:hypothetical protein
MEPGELFTCRHALADGFTNRDLTDMVRSGHITRVARGVYRLGSVALPDPSGIARSLKAEISHASAAAWYGASLVLSPDGLHLTVPRSRGRRQDEIPGVTIHRADIPSSDLLVVRRTLVTAPIRTGLDLARSLPTSHAVATLDNMIRGGLLTRSDLLAAALALPVAPGRQSAITVADLVDARAESVFESISRVDMAVAGLPIPELQVNICDRDGNWIARVDFAWKTQRVILECDGWEFHSNRDAFERDRRRWTALSRAGWTVIVVTWRDVMESPGYLVAAMSDVLGA